MQPPECCGAAEDMPGDRLRPQQHWWLGGEPRNKAVRDNGLRRAVSRSMKAFQMLERLRLAEVLSDRSTFSGESLHRSSLLQPSLVITFGSCWHLSFTLPFAQTDIRAALFSIPSLICYLSEIAIFSRVF